MNTTDHPLIGKRIERVSGKGSPMTVAHVYMERELRVVVIDGGGVIRNEPLATWNWRIITDEPTATAAPEPDTDGWIPLDGTRFPDVEPDAHINIWVRSGRPIEDAGRATVFDFGHSGGGNDIMAWKRA